jgi:probable phosphoglycerate mutase
MIDLLLIRHGPTDWNAQGIIQGQTDTPLSEDGRRMVSTWSLPTEFADFEWVSSPLQRAVETAQVMGATRLELENALQEMDWGRWEGTRVAELRRNLGAIMNENEQRGLDFKPPGGESPRMVQQRLVDWFATISGRNHSLIALTHKGVIRATFALATGWDMLGEPPLQLRRDCGQLFTLDTDNRPVAVRLNIPLNRGQ